LFFFISNHYSFSAFDYNWKLFLTTISGFYFTHTHTKTGLPLFEIINSSIHSKLNYKKKEMITKEKKEVLDPVLKKKKQGCHYLKL